MCWAKVNADVVRTGHDEYLSVHKGVGMTTECDAEDGALDATLVGGKPHLDLTTINTDSAPTWVFESPSRNRSRS
jgi:hypothetical protein